MYKSQLSLANIELNWYINKSMCTSGKLSA